MHIRLLWFVTPLLFVSGSCQRTEAPSDSTSAPAVSTAPTGVPVRTQPVDPTGAVSTQPGNLTSPPGSDALPPGAIGKGEPGKQPTAATAPPTNGEYKCLRVVDANTLELEKIGMVMFAGLRAPGTGQPGANEVQQQLVRAVQGNPVVAEFCAVTPKGDGGRWRVIVAYYDVNKKLRNLNQLLLLEGLAQAQVDEKCHVALASYQQFQDAAKQARKGLWATVWANAPAATSLTGPGHSGQQPTSGPGTK